MGIFSRLFKVGQSEANSLVDKLEDPIKLTEQGIRDLKKDLEKAVEALAEVKSYAIRAKRDMNSAKERAADYEQKAILLLKKAQSGDITQEEADRLATQALDAKAAAEKEMLRHEADAVRFDQNAEKLEVTVKTLKEKIVEFENELRNLKARVRVSEASKNINKKLSSIDSSSTLAQLEKMKEKIDQQEAIAEAYEGLSTETKTLDQELEEALGKKGTASQSQALSDLKSKLNM
ncbi:MAG TPA: phage shock protein A [Porphyromonadaceae bacterium]|nr:phage shock protein A [Porphyromonadaceae bacterium]